MEQGKEKIPTHAAHEWRTRQNAQETGAEGKADGPSFSTPKLCIFL